MTKMKIQHDFDKYCRPLKTLFMRNLATVFAVQRPISYLKLENTVMPPRLMTSFFLMSCMMMEITFLLLFFLQKRRNSAQKKKKEKEPSLSRMNLRERGKVLRER